MTATQRWQIWREFEHTLKQSSEAQDLLAWKLAAHYSECNGVLAAARRCCQCRRAQVLLCPQGECQQSTDSVTAQLQHVHPSQNLPRAKMATPTRAGYHSGPPENLSILRSFRSSHSLGLFCPSNTIKINLYELCYKKRPIKISTGTFVNLLQL